MATVYCDTAGVLTANCGLTTDIWMKPLLARLPGATEATVHCELMAAINEFYFQSNAWREQIGPYRISQNQDVIFLNPVDAYSNVKFVFGAWLQNGSLRTYLTPLTTRETETLTAATPTHYFCTEPYTIRLWPTPEADLGHVFWVDCTLVPLPDATRLPNIAASHHFEGILEYALARLFMIPNKPWTDAMMGLKYAQTARRRAMEFRDMAERGYTRTDAPMRFPAFA